MNSSALKIKKNGAAKVEMENEAANLKVAYNAGNVIENLENKTTSLAVVGLGYVGLPIALEFANNYSVVGFDIKPERVDMLNQSIDPSRELDASAFDNKDIQFSYKAKHLAKAQFYVVAVPTPIDRLNKPDLTPLKKATATVAHGLKKGDYVVFESTVYPGCTEEECIPILERISGLKVNVDFKVGYSPERINPGDKERTLTTIPKIVSGHDAESLENIAQVYETVIKAGVHRAPSLKVAEAAKIIENTQRDVNIALMNELSNIMDRMGVATHEVLEAAGTKWNFLNFFPGLVGGHCIGVDPYYLVHKSKQLGYTPTLISSSRQINDSMPADVANRLARSLRDRGRKWNESKVLVKGITFKENVSDIRNSKAVKLVETLELFGCNVTVEDPHADATEVKDEYGINLGEAKGTYDAIVVAVMHDEYRDLDVNYLRKHGLEHTVVLDIRGSLRDNLPAFNYLAL